MTKQFKSVSMLLFLLSMSAGPAIAATGSAPLEAPVVQQNETCTGVVLDETGETVIGAAVQVINAFLPPFVHRNLLVPQVLNVYDVPIGNNPIEEGNNYILVRLTAKNVFESQVTEQVYIPFLGNFFCILFSWLLQPIVVIFSHIT